MNYLNKLNSILKTTNWPQEELARHLNVSFVSLNAWLNKRAIPRSSAIVRINELYLFIVGADEISQTELDNKTKQALSKELTAKTIINDQQMLERLTIRLTYHTNTIEGSTMTMLDVKDVLYNDRVLSNRTAIEQAEARNHRSALYWLLDELTDKRFSINEDVILSLHLRLMNGIVSDAGKYRAHSVRIMGTHVPLANWPKIPHLIADYINLVNSKTENRIELMAKSHAIFEKIHPFSDGNGRTGRLLLLAQALQKGCMPPIITKDRKQAYYKYLQLAQLNDNYEPLKLFMAESIIYCQEILTPTDINS